MNELELKEQDIREKIKQLAIEKSKLAIEQTLRDKQIKLEEKRSGIKIKEKLVKKYVRNFPNSKRFISRTTFFFNRLEALQNYRKDNNEALDYLTEMNLISEISMQYKSCVQVLDSEVRSSFLPIMSELMEWRRKVDKALKRGV